MAGSKKTNAEETISEATATAVIEPQAEESVKNAAKGNTATKYKVTELINASEKLFNVKKECAVAALKPLKVSEMTVKEATEKIKEFMSKEVK